MQDYEREWEREKYGRKGTRKRTEKKRKYEEEENPGKRTGGSYAREEISRKKWKKKIWKKKNTRKVCKLMLSRDVIPRWKVRLRREKKYMRG